MFLPSVFSRSVRSKDNPNPLLNVTLRISDTEISSFQYAPRSTLANKAFANWERKSQHILAEIVKYEVYVESLKMATSLRLKKRGEKALEKALVDSSPREDAGESSRRWRGSPEAKQKPEDDGPTTPGATVHRSSRSSSQHRREMAET